MIEVLIIDDDPNKLRRELLDAQATHTPLHRAARELGGEDSKQRIIDFMPLRVTISSENIGEYDDDNPVPLYIAVGRVAIDGSKETFTALLKIHSKTNELTPAAEIEITDEEF